MKRSKDERKMKTKRERKKRTTMKVEGTIDARLRRSVLFHVTYSFLLAAHDTIRGTIHYHRTYGRIDDGITQKFNLWTKSKQFQQFWGHF
jgi:hypothetical protein